MHPGTVFCEIFSEEFYTVSQVIFKLDYSLGLEKNFKSLQALTLYETPFIYQKGRYTKPN